MIQQFHLSVYVQTILHHLHLEEVPLPWPPRAFSSETIQCSLDTADSTTASVYWFFLSALQLSHSTRTTLSFHKKSISPYCFVEDNAKEETVDQHF